MMKKEQNIYLKLFLSTLQLSAFTFGGGYVIISLLQKKFVEKFKWINEKEMLDIVAISQSSPGAIAVNSSILIGYRMAGVWGALCTLLGTILPPLVIITGISFFYEAFRDNEIVSAVLKGMQAGIAAVIVDVVYRMGKRYFVEKDILSIVLIIGVFCMSFFLNINVIFIILGGIVLGVIYHFIKKSMTKNEKPNDEICKNKNKKSNRQNDIFDSINKDNENKEDEENKDNSIKQDKDMESKKDSVKDEGGKDDLS